MAGMAGGGPRLLEEALVMTFSRSSNAWPPSHMDGHVTDSA
jgi:hypothetical protein